MCAGEDKDDDEKKDEKEKKAYLEWLTFWEEEGAKIAMASNLIAMASNPRAMGCKNG